MVGWGCSAVGSDFAVGAVAIGGTAAVGSGSGIGLVPGDHTRSFSGTGFSTGGKDWAEDSVVGVG